MRIILFVVLGLVTASIQANAKDNVSGNDMYSFCTSPSEVKQAFCLGNIIGTVEGMKWGIFAAFSAASEGESSTDELNELSEFVLTRISQVT